MRITTSRYFPVLLLLLASLTLAACNGAEQGAALDQAEPEVAVMVAVPQQRPVKQVYQGRLTAYRRAEVRARAAGILLKRHYEEGREVAEGELLFSIDDAELQTNLLAAQSTLAKAEAEHQGTVDTLNRHRSLFQSKSINEHDYISTQTSEKQAAAAVKSAQAVLAKAELDLSYAKVTAPIPGRAGLAQVSEGALVGQDELTQMTTIEQVDPIYADFSQPASDLLTIDKNLRAGRLIKIGETAAQVRLKMSDGDFYEHPGRLIFTGTSVDQTTDNVAMRAVFPNPDKTLRPGTYLSVELTEAVNPLTFLVPRDSLIREGNESRLLVVSEENLVEKVTVEATELEGKNWVVTAGLKAGDKVVINGTQSAGLEGQQVSVKTVGTENEKLALLERFAD